MYKTAPFLEKKLLLPALIMRLKHIKVDNLIQHLFNQTRLVVYDAGLYNKFLQNIEKVLNAAGFKCSNTYIASRSYFTAYL
jgi:hypothetical protein